MKTLKSAKCPSSVAILRRVDGVPILRSNTAEGGRSAESEMTAAAHELHFTSHALFPLTPALYLRERVNCRPRWWTHEALGLYERDDGCSLSPAERAGVRGKQASISRTAPNRA